MSKGIQQSVDRFEREAVGMTGVVNMSGHLEGGIGRYKMQATIIIVHSSVMYGVTSDMSIGLCSTSK